MTEEKRKCIVKSNLDIKQKLLDKITQLGLTYSDVVEDAREKHGRRFTLAMLSRYFNMGGQLTCTISQQDIIWLCDRYGLDVKVSVINARNSQKSNQQKLKRKYG